ncbi:retinol dehydrogenase 11 [Ixodes scapularis]
MTRADDLVDPGNPVSWNSGWGFWLLASLVPAAGIALFLLKVYVLATVGRCTSTRDMSGKTVVVTGANSGIGKETAKELARRNARVILACRNQDKARLAARDILSDTGKQVVCMQLDLCSLKSVRRFAKDILEREDRLDVLINNAGIMPPVQRVETEDGFESTFQANHLGPFLLTHLLLDLLKRSAPSRVVMLTSVGQWFGSVDWDNLDFRHYKQERIYCNTKLYNTLYTVELARRLANTGVTANCCHPGFVKTELASHSSDLHTKFTDILIQNFGKSPEEGAQTTVHLAVSEVVEHVTGRYFADCRPSVAPRWALDPLSAKRFWDASEEMLGLRDQPSSSLPAC